MRVIRVAAAMVLSSCVTPTVTVGRSDYKDRCAAYLNLGELDKAELQCQVAREFNEADPEVLNNLGIVEYRRGKLNASKKFFIRALRLNNDMAQAYVNLGVVALDQNDLPTARDRFLQALRINPEYAEARHDLGLAYMGMNQLPHAEKTFLMLVATAPQLSQGYANVGSVMLLTARPKEAVAWFEKAIDLEQGYPEAWRGKGAALLALGQDQRPRCSKRETEAWAGSAAIWL